MKRIKRLSIAFLIVIALLSCGIFAQKVLAAYGKTSACSTGGTPNDTTYFPYEFICGGDNTYTTPMQLGGNPDATGHGDPGNALQVNKGTTIDMHFSFTTKGLPKYSPSQQSQALVWITVDANSNDLSGGNITSPSGVTTLRCPGSGAGGQPGVVYNYQDPSGNDASPAAYDKTGNRGYEDCGSEGSMVYWANQNPAAGATTGDYPFQIPISSSSTAGNVICVRANVSVYYPDGPKKDLKTFPDANAGENDQRYTANHVVKQSERQCYVIIGGSTNVQPEGDINTVGCSSVSLRAYDKNPTRGTQFRLMRRNASNPSNTSQVSVGTTPNANYLAPPANLNKSIWDAYGGGPITFVLFAKDVDTGVEYKVDERAFANPGCDVDHDPVFTLGADCNNVTLSGLYDSEMGAGGVHYSGTIFQRHADGSIGAAAGTIDGRGSSVGGVLPYDYFAWEDAENQGWIIQVGVYNVDVNGNDAAFGYVQQAVVSPQGVGGPCYVASCKSVVVSSPAGYPAGGVEAGKPFQVTATFHNDQPGYTSDFLPRGLSTGPGSDFYLTGTMRGQPVWGTAIESVGRDVPAQQDFSVTFNLTAPAGVNSVSLGGVHAEYNGLFAISGSCPAITVSTFVPFTATPHATGNSPSPSEEDPQNIPYNTYVENQNSGHVAIAVPTNSSFYFTPAGSPPGTQNYVDGPPVSPSGPWPSPNQPPSVYVLNDSYSPPAINAGDEYCAYLQLAFTAGDIGPDGVVANPHNDPGITNPVKSCFTVHNKPFFRAYGGSLSSGGTFKSTSATCSGAGALGGWYNNQTGNYGSGAQLGAIALTTINGVASGQGGSLSGPSHGRGLTFANSGGVPPTDLTSPEMGGNFGGNHCLYEPQAEDPPTNHGGGSTSTDALPGGAHHYSSSITLNGGTVGIGKDLSIFVDGDIHITNNITYQDTGWSVSASGSNLPSFILVATGNIYIDPGVTQLDGSYVAHRPGGLGRIYTCANAAGNGPETSNVYDICRNQLTVFGSLVADRVNLMRTYGSLRDDKPAAPSPCANSGGAAPISPQTCAAEVINLSPELYLSNSNKAIKPPANGATRYDAITSLPPVL